MLKNERHGQILTILKERRTVTVDELAKMLYVSPSTARRDLRILQSEGFLYYHYGCISLISDSSKALPLELRKHEMHTAKNQIGNKAAELIKNGDVLFIDSSSTCINLIDNLKGFENLTVITYGLHALEHLESMNITTYCIGGRLLRNSMAFVGNLAEESIQRFHVDKVFFSVSSLSRDGILSDGGENENNLHRILLKQNCQKICLLDSGKVDSSSLFRTCSLDELDYIVSDVDIYQQVSPPANGKGKLLLASKY